MKPQRFGPEWWSCYAVAWAHAWRSAAPGFTERTAEGFVHTPADPAAVAKRAIAEADFALAAFIEATKGNA